MSYKDLRTLFHISEKEAEAEYNARFGSKDAHHLDFQIGQNHAFFVMDSGVYELIIKSLKLDREITEIADRLPAIASEQYMTSCLIEEIVLTNEIEGVRSTRREIGEVLEGLAKKDKYGRFYGIVDKYLALKNQENISLAKPKDIRAIYDDLVLAEVTAANPKNAPDGELFRAGPVSVLDAAQRPIHQGVEPESKIIELLQSALDLLDDESIPALVRVAVFHFMFAYIHPFYDGNGRTNRFISSYMLTRSYNSLVGFRLSYAVKEHIKKYYKGFSVCEHPLNRGDLTPFVLEFSNIVIDAMESLSNALSEKEKAMREAEAAAKAVFPAVKKDERLYVVLKLLIRAALFTDNGITADEILEAGNISNATAVAKRKTVEAQGLLIKDREGHKVFYRMDIKKLLEDETKATN